MTDYLFLLHTLGLLSSRMWVGLLLLFFFSDSVFSTYILAWWFKDFKTNGLWLLDSDSLIVEQSLWFTDCWTLTFTHSFLLCSYIWNTPSDFLTHWVFLISWLCQTLFWLTVFPHSVCGSLFVPHSVYGSLFVPHSVCDSLFVKHSVCGSLFVPHSVCDSLFVPHSVCGSLFVPHSVCDSLIVPNYVVSWQISESAAGVPISTIFRVTLLMCL